MTSEGPRAIRVAWISAFVICAALLSAPWRGHVDDLDAQIYLVVVRNMVRDRTWLDLRYLPSFLPVFREHLPFGLWPAAAAIRLLGEWAINPLYATMMLGAIGTSGLIARRLGGDAAGVAAVILLGTCESIWQYGGRLLLEPPLLLFATGAAGAALANLWPAAAALGAVATLIKGPFGLLPLACVCAVNGRNWRAWAALLAAVAPVAVFLALDPSGGWRDGYLRNQLLVSASGARTDGVSAWWFLPAVIAGRFWPGLPFLLAGLWRARRDARIRPLAFACLLMAALLCVPQRKWGNQAYVAFPLLAALAGVGAAPLLRKMGHPRWLAPALAAAAVVFSVSGAGALVLRPPCAFSTALAGALRSIPRGAMVSIESPQGIWPAVAQLAAEGDVRPSPAQGGSDCARFAATRGVPVPAGWQKIASAPDWSILRRSAPAPRCPAEDR
ncbi:MAG TPA: hypothetical protein VFL36_18555 [Myxococcales bacterium]|nr:hypothetical protein [Myxococcales bacterium]